MSLCDETEYPHIFANTYWGSLPTCSLNETTIDASVIEHRNSFVTTYLSSAYISDVPSRIRDELFHAWHDHVEVYFSTALNAYLCASHPYVHNNEHRARLLEEAKRDGFEEFLPMYAKNALTLVKVVK